MKKLILILLLIGMITVSGCGNKISEDDEALLNDAVERAAKYGAGECDSFSSEELKSRCVERFNKRVEERNVKASYLKEAIESDDESRCELAENKEFCKEMYSSMLVFSKGGKGIEYCEGISDPRAQLNCFDVYYMYKSLEDKSYCEQIKDIGIKKGCVE